MYSNSDSERLFLRYKSESVASQESIQAFCLRNNVPYNLFEKWYRDTRHKLVRVKVEGHPDSVLAVSAAVGSLESFPASPFETVRIRVDIRMSNGIHLQQLN